MPKFTNAKKFNKINIKNIPEYKPILYRLLNNSNNEIYKGIVKRDRTLDRLLEHLTIEKEVSEQRRGIKIRRLNFFEKSFDFVQNKKH